MQRFWEHSKKGVNRFMKVVRLKIWTYFDPLSLGLHSACNVKETRSCIGGPLNLSKCLDNSTETKKITYLLPPTTYHLGSSIIYHFTFD